MASPSRPCSDAQPVSVRAGGYIEEISHPGRRFTLYGNLRLLLSEAHWTPSMPSPNGNLITPQEQDDLEKRTEEAVLRGRIVTCGYHHEGWRRVAVVPLRWGSPRIVVLPGSLEACLGPDLLQEPFRAAHLWRYQWDCSTDLAITTRNGPNYRAMRQPAIDRLCRRIVNEPEFRKELYDAAVAAGGQP